MTVLNVLEHVYLRTLSTTAMDELNKGEAVKKSTEEPDLANTTGTEPVTSEIITKSTDKGNSCCTENAMISYNYIYIWPKLINLYIL